MKFYEVILGISNCGREIGKTCIQLTAENPFSAATEAERLIDSRYGADTYGHAVKVNTITREEFLYCAVA